ncbi:MAG: hypothetical protein ACLVJZ_00655, partial [[Clostridium] leptum]
KGSIAAAVRAAAVLFNFRMSLPVAAVRSYLLLSKKALFGPLVSKGVRWFSFAALAPLMV